MAVGIILLSAVDPLAGYAAERTIDIKHLGEGQSIVRVDARAKYLLLPVEESSPESKLYMIVDNDVVRTFNVRLAVNKVDYFVPVDLSGYADKHISFNFQLAPESALCWKEMKLSDQFDSSNREKFRPAYHFSPAWGWIRTRANPHDTARKSRSLPTHEPVPQCPKCRCLWNRSVE